MYIIVVVAIFYNGPRRNKLTTMDMKYSSSAAIVQQKFYTKFLQLKLLLESMNVFLSKDFFCRWIIPRVTKCFCRYNFSKEFLFEKIFRTHIFFFFKKIPQPIHQMGGNFKYIGDDIGTYCLKNKLCIHIWILMICTRLLLWILRKLVNDIKRRKVFTFQMTNETTTTMLFFD